MKISILQKIEPDDKIVKIRNYGWYVASTRVDYELNDGSNKIAVQQKTKLARLSDYTFYIPNSVSLTAGIGIVFSVDIIAGPRLLSIKIPSEPFCTYIYGYTFFAWAVRVDCNTF